MSSTTVVAILFFELLLIATTNFSFCYGRSTSVIGCIESERQALLSFKHGLKDPSNRLASWNDSSGDGDCCTWAGVHCDNLTGRVLELYLRNPVAGMESSSSFHDIEDQMRSYKMSELSHNDFEGLQIPGFIGSMENLRYLNLSETGFSGLIPHQLGNLSNPHCLDLSSNTLYVENLCWLSGLSSLKHLDFSGVNLSKASDNWPSKMNMLSSLVVLRLEGCQIQHFPPLLSEVNFSSLAAIDLASNNFENSLISSWVFSLSHLVYLDLSSNRFQAGPIPDGLKNLTSLRYLDLSYNSYNSSIPNWLNRFNHLEHLYLPGNSLQGTIPSALGNFTSIKDIDLSGNRLEGRIPKSLGKACNLRSLSLGRIKLSQDIAEVLNIFSGCVANGLELLDLGDSQLFGYLTDQLGGFKNLYYLDLSYNSISGTIPSSLGRLSSLVSLDFSYNKLNGTISQILFVNLTRLSYFAVSENSLVLKVSPNWVPPFQLYQLHLRSCHLGSQFPSWFHSQRFLEGLDISNSGIFNVPHKFWKSISWFMYLNFSHNQIHGKIPNLTHALELRSLDLSWNNFSGPLPLVASDVYLLDLSHNSLSGSLNHFLCYGKNESHRLQYLDLANNFLSEELPDCWVNWQYLTILNLGGNQFIGNVLTSMGALTLLKSLHLHRNSFSGAIPVSFANCTELLALDVSENEFGSSIPTWIGENFSELLILNLRSNKFYGLLPEELCRLSSLQILDLACNNLSGMLPRCIRNFSAMATMNYSVEDDFQYKIGLVQTFVEDATLVTKGKPVEYNTILNLVRTLDLSLNNFSGEIPVEVTILGALQTLNLSHNSFTGKIPGCIGDMRLLESIDFSANQLSGEIPLSMSSLTFLSHLNLSDNNLTGKIPSSTQLQSLEASLFTGNELCGPPLPRKCTETFPTQDQANSRAEDDDDGDEVDWFYVSMALGFVVGFWGLIGPLIVHRRWRYMYCRFLDRLGDKIPYVVRRHF
ncbi:hypothetical protein ACOSQ2_009485 [Xanthoceras sorbifolium]